MRLTIAMIAVLVAECAAIQAAPGSETRPVASRPRPSVDFWATIPRGICIWKNRPFTQEEITAVAKYRLVQTMIPNGIPWRGGDGNVAVEIKKRNPDALVIGYKNIVVHYEYHAHPEIFRDHPDWFIYDRQGKPAMHNGKRPLHDLRKPAMRQWWVDDVHGLLATPGFDGILIDAVTKVYCYAPILDALSPVEQDEYAGGFHAMMEETRKRCTGQGLLIGNCLRAIHDDAGLAILRRHYDGSYLELFDTPMGAPGRPAASYEEWVARGIEAVRQASAEGRLVFLTMSPGVQNLNDVADVRPGVGPAEPIDYDKLYADHEYKLAMFLICAGERSYWGYQYSRNAATDPRQWDPDFRNTTGPSARQKARRSGTVSPTRAISGTQASRWISSNARDGSPGEPPQGAPERTPHRRDPRIRQPQAGSAPPTQQRPCAPRVANPFSTQPSRDSHSATGRHPASAPPHPHGRDAASTGFA